MSCRTFTSQAVEDAITQMNSTIADPDLFRLFENSCESHSHLRNFGGRAHRINAQMCSS